MNREAKRNINSESKKGYNLSKQMTIPELKMWSRDIDKEDERMSLIVRNGNAGYKVI